MRFLSRLLSNLLITNMLESMYILLIIKNYLILLIIKIIKKLNTDYKNVAKIASNVT